MTKQNPDQLDKLLQQWDGQQAPCEIDLDRLRERIVRSFDEATLRPYEPVSMHRPDGLRRVAAAWFATGAAAAALIAVGLFWLLQPDGRKSTATVARAGLPPDYAWLQESQLRDKSVLLKEMESIFDGKAMWLVETNGDVEIGVAERPVHTGARPLAVRVIVERRRVGQPDWTIVWAADVISRSEETVLLRPDSPTGTQLTMWAYVLPDGMIAVDADLTLGQSIPVKMSTSSLQKDGEPVEVHSTHAGGYEFRLFQTAAVLKEPVI